MRYPDGKIITVGDLIWWNEGVCVGFIFPLWWAHETTFSAARQIAGDPVYQAHSMAYERFSKDLATVGYAWFGCSMAWLFWYVTWKKN